MHYEFCIQGKDVLMRNQYKNASFSLQLFGEGATGETGADAALQQNNSVTGEPADSQPQDSAPSREEAFESLIRGEYKDLYEKRVSQIVQKRLAKQKQGKPNQEEAVSQSEEQEQSKMPSNTHVLADAVYEDLSAQARNLSEVYPSFDLAKELNNPAFANLLRIPSVDMQTAYELTHKEEILPAVIAAAVQETQKRIANGMLTGSVRPKENGTAAQSTPVIRQTVSTFSKEQMEDICRRVQRGEKIYL